MEIKKIILACASTILLNNTQAQEMNATVIVNANAITGVDAGVFKTLQQSLQNFINQRKWTNAEYATNEKIDCNFQLTITKKMLSTENAYECKLNVQAGRDIYGTSYSSPIINLQDPEVNIRYLQFQPIDFNENRISGADALTSNLSAIVAYYVYMILGLHQDSYKLKSGTISLAKAQNIVNNAPESGGVNGWKADGKNNRYWKIDNLLSPRFTGFREQFYAYHRDGLDQMSTKPKEALEVINTCIENLSVLNSENPNTALITLYFSTKSEEYLQMIPQLEATKKDKAINKISIMDVTNATKYRALLK